MINLALKTEYSFKQCFGKIEDLLDGCKESALGIADLDNTYGHIQFAKYCKNNNIKPIFGVRLRVVPDGDKNRNSQNYWVFLAKNDEGLKEIYRLVAKAYDQFFYFPKLFSKDVNNMSNDIFIISTGFPAIDIKVNYKMITPFNRCEALGRAHVAVQDNFFPLEEDEEIYQLLAGARKDGEDGYTYNFEQRVVPMHIVDEYSFTIEQGENTEVIADQCNAEIEKAEMVKFKGKGSILRSCLEGGIRLGLDLHEGEYADRLTRELALIEDKGYIDYFRIVADLMKFANKHMLVGPARGSSAGSLVCYLLNITKVDPIKFDLIFERFIDVNRFDLPDIDIDFPDSKRYMVIDYLHEKYGNDNVKNLANINRLKAKSAIDLFGMGLCIPKEDCDILKDSIIERSAGDARNGMCMMDTFNETEQGKWFIDKYPKMRLVEQVENHAQHSGKHAAGIIVSNKPLTNFGGVNSRDDVIMMDKKDAEIIGLLKIDCLGLRNLSILEDTAKLIGKHKDFYYDLPLDDEATFDIFRNGRLNGIFQFEGQALKMLNKSIIVNCFDDIVIITSLARPGALRSGGAAKFAKRRNGDDEATYFGQKHKKITEPTYGVMVFQEQLMSLAKELANFTWMEISDLRLAAAKSLGDSYFSKYSEKFVAGCIEYSGMTEDEAKLVWKDMQHAGSWLFNKSHAVSYGLISYFTAYMKAHYPLEFLAACLNHSEDDSALRMLRDAYENDDIEYIPIDSDESLVKWSVCNGKLLGGLTNIKGVGEVRAKRMIEAREGSKVWTEPMIRILTNPTTAFDELYPTKATWKDIYDNPGKFGLNTITDIRDVDLPGEYTIIGKLIKKNLNDLNEYNKVQKRGHRLEEHTLYLNLILEDDHDSIMVSIGRFDYDRLSGGDIIAKARLNTDYFLAQGKVAGSWRGISVNEILNLTEWRKNDGN